MSSLLKAIAKAESKRDECPSGVRDYSESKNHARKRPLRLWLIIPLLVVTLTLAVLVNWALFGVVEDIPATGAQSYQATVSTHVDANAAIAADEAAALYRKRELELAATPVVGEPQVSSLWADAMTMAELPPQVLLGLESMTYSAHVYNPGTGQGFAFINGNRLQPGNFLGIAQVQELSQEGIVFKAQGYLFKLPALQDWQLASD